MRCEGPHETFQCQPINQNFYDSNSFGFEQFQPSQFPVIHQPPEKLSEEVLQAREDLMDSIQNFLKKFSRFSFTVTPKVLVQACDTLIKIKQAKSEEVQKLLNKLLLDVQSINEELAEYINTPNWNLPPSSYDDDDDEYSFAAKEYLMTCSNAITSGSPKIDSLIMVDKHLDTIPETESDEFIKSSVENLVQILSESEDESECDVPIFDDFTTFSNPLFDSDDDLSSSDDESFSDEDVSKEIYSNPLFEEDIISTKINPHPFNVEFDLVESLLNRDALIISSPKFDFLFEEFSDELARSDLIPPGINETDFVPEEDIHFVEKFLYDNSSPRPPEDFHANPNTNIESLPSLPIPVVDSDSLREEIDIFPGPDESIPPGIESDDHDSEGDDNSISLPEFESFHVDYPDSGDST
ncbi:hypothetical protein Tco_1440992, partial [Tanacetum coccineum]